jgi:hypothetical protein
LNACRTLICLAHAAVWTLGAMPSHVVACLPEAALTALVQAAAQALPKMTVDFFCRRMFMSPSSFITPGDAACARARTSASDAAPPRINRMAAADA